MKGWDGIFMLIGREEKIKFIMKRIVWSIVNKNNKKEERRLKVRE